MEISKKGKDKLNSGFDSDLSQNQVDCINQSLDNLQSDIATIITETVLRVMKEDRKSRRYVEVGYRS